MLVSWEWLSQYVYLKQTPDEIANRLSLSGLNHEETSSFDDDSVLDLEVTSHNRLPAIYRPHHPRSQSWPQPSLARKTFSSHRMQIS